MHATEDGRQHWDDVYRAVGPDQVSWFQRQPAMSLSLIDELGLDPGLPLLDVGGGASTVVDHLLDRGHRDLTVLDISGEALRQARLRLADRAPLVDWVQADLLEWTPPRQFALWHDRAVFHFLTTRADRERYRALAAGTVTPGGYVVLATFAADGPDRCSGLPVTRYTADELTTFLGDAFTAVTNRREEHVTPGGATQSFTWLVARRRGGS